MFTDVNVIQSWIVSAEHPVKYGKQGLPLVIIASQYNNRGNKAMQMLTFLAKD